MKNEKFSILGRLATFLGMILIILGLILTLGYGIGEGLIPGGVSTFISMPFGLIGFILAIKEIKEGRQKTTILYIVFSSLLILFYVFCILAISVFANW